MAIGFTGLILWFPNLICAYLPGETLNIAKVIYSPQALLATGFVFTIHFFNTHLRPDNVTNPNELAVPHLEQRQAAMQVTALVADPCRRRSP